MATITQMTSVK